MRFILIDRLLELQPGVRAVACKTFSPDEDVFRDHFPGHPLVPGTLLLESMAQTAGWLTIATLGEGKGAQLLMVREAKFRRPVKPGMHVRLTAVLVSSRPSATELQVDASVADELVASARIVLHVFDLREDATTEQFLAWARTTFRQLGGDELWCDRGSGAPIA